MKINLPQTEFEAGLNLNLSDDCILNEIIKYKKETDKKVILLTSDISLSLRAPIYSIETVLLDSKYLLKADGSMKQEIKKPYKLYHLITKRSLIQMRKLKNTEMI